MEAENVALRAKKTLSTELLELVLQFSPLHYETLLQCSACDRPVLLRHKTKCYMTATMLYFLVRDDVFCESCAKTRLAMPWPSLRHDRGRCAS